MQDSSSICCDICSIGFNNEQASNIQLSAFKKPGSKAQHTAADLDIASRIRMGSADNHVNMIGNVAKQSKVHDALYMLSDDLCIPSLS